jgi:fructose-1,6-bisphosphatase I
MKLRDFLTNEKTGKQLTDLVLFFADQSVIIKKGFFTSLMKKGIDEHTKNIYGEEQMDLDKFADDVFVEGLKKTRLAHYIATEEQGQIIEIENPKNNFGVVIDPLDGSSLIDVNLTIGSIIGIYPGPVLAQGSQMVAALTILTLTVGKGVHEFVMNDSGEFILKDRDIKISDGNIYAPGALRRDYLPAHRKWIEYLEEKGYKLRFSGAFVADVHQILHKGGVFAYPGLKGKEKGKLRLLFEANPMGKIVHEAGGAISNGKMDILQITPKAMNDITPIYIGGKKEIALIEKFMS